MISFLKDHKIGFIDISTVIVVLSVIYLTFCVFDYIQPPARTGIEYVFIEKGYNTGIIKHSVDNSDDPYNKEKIHAINLMIDPGDTVHVGFKIERLKTADVWIDRIFISGGNQKYHVNSVSRNLNDSNLGERRITADYKIPLFLKEGCGAYIFSRNSYEYAYNLISLIKPIVYETPKINLCVNTSSTFNAEINKLFP